jgi:hypothetical protein
MYLRRLPGLAGARLFKLFDIGFVLSDVSGSNGGYDSS